MGFRVVSFGFHSLLTRDIFGFGFLLQYLLQNLDGGQLGGLVVFSMMESVMWDGAFWIGMD